MRVARQGSQILIDGHYYDETTALEVIDEIQAEIERVQIFKSLQDDITQVIFLDDLASRARSYPDILRAIDMELEPIRNAAGWSCLEADIDDEIDKRVTRARAMEDTV